MADRWIEHVTPAQRDAHRTLLSALAEETR
jgi:hypothetical protein